MLLTMSETLPKSAALEGAEGFHVGDEVPDQPRALLLRFLGRLVDGNGRSRRKQRQHEGGEFLAGRRLRFRVLLVRLISYLLAASRVILLLDGVGHPASLHVLCVGDGAARTRFPGFFGNPCPRPSRTSALNKGRRVSGVLRQQSGAAQGGLPAMFAGTIPDPIDGGCEGGDATATGD